MSVGKKVVDFERSSHIFNAASDPFARPLDCGFDYPAARFPLLLNPMLLRRDAEISPPTILRTDAVDDSGAEAAATPRQIALFGILEGFRIARSGSALRFGQVSTWMLPEVAKGAMYEQEPLRITKRDTVKGVTFYEVLKVGDENPVQCKIDTCNEWILRTGVCLGGPRSVHRVMVGGQYLARIVAGENTSDDKDRIYVDHADGDCCNDTAANLNWVNPSFNTFNTARKGNSSGYFGVRQNGRKFLIHTAHNYMPYPNGKTAARVYDLACTLKYGDLLRKSRICPATSTETAAFLWPKRSRTASASAKSMSKTLRNWQIAWDDLWLQA
ncbi:uncharacterized protein PAN0_002c0932 [Moesziomyces antarcticus]|uniref:uncharacterized protein n=1 Tax=Pseudozyma antarctica TaxID=84753 RepID=UPI0007197A5A|nr:uncharacterized protein PAN0_002c0932 [Moesziomyces antarcticus]GAK62730.1 hypothetical protein PAN0_002c0932 [Moesziomyces antarcticus]